MLRVIVHVREIQIHMNSSTSLPGSVLKQTCQLLHFQSTWASSHSEQKKSY